MFRLVINENPFLTNETLDVLSEGQLEMYLRQWISLTIIDSKNGIFMSN